jgi:uncharacterized RDD family membrane protein YckC
LVGGFFLNSPDCAHVRSDNLSQIERRYSEKRVGLSVADYSGQRLSLKSSFIRNFGKLISLSILGLGFLWILFNKERQGWHDKMAKTLVVRN